MSTASRNLLPATLVEEFIAWITSGGAWKRTPERDRIRENNPYEVNAVRDPKGKLHIIYARYKTAAGKDITHVTTPPTLERQVRTFLAQRKAPTP
jgi:hypothetical protein